MNVQFQDYHIGLKLKHNLNALTGLKVLAALKNEKGDFFLRTDALRKHFTLGCNHTHNEGKARHSIEWLYDHSGKTKGIKG